MSNSSEAAIQKKLDRLNKRILDGTAAKQRIWQVIKEYNGISDERLDATAIIDCTREYTYRQMFDEWDKYARVYSALGVTKENKSRVAIAGGISSEPLFAFFGANMTGASVSMFSYPDFLPSGKWKTMIKAENITDLVISDMMVTPGLWKELKKEKDDLGLKHIILIHSKLGGPTVGPAELFFNEFNYHALKNAKGAVFMEDLIEKYADGPIKYCKDSGNTISVITHTSGTTKGTRKPIPYKDKDANICASLGYCERHHVDIYRGDRSLIPFDFSSYYCLIGEVCSSFENNCTVVLTFFGFLHPKFIKAIEYYKVTHLFAPCFLLDTWLERDDIDDVDFSSMKALDTGGSYASPSKIKQYNSFAEKHGYKGDKIVNSYGMSEVGDAYLYPCENATDADVMGFPVPVEDYMIKDENDGKFYTAAQGERTGTLHITSDGMSTNVLDGKKLFDYVRIGGRNFICTNDLVRVNKNGSLSYAGRADKFFVNNEGVRFDSGLVDTKFSAHPSISKCAIVPVLDKRIHDTVPILYVIPEKNVKDAPETITQIIKDIYFKDELIKKTALPSQFIIVDSVPCNSNGKVDIYRITRERLQGEAYNILLVIKNGKAIDIRTELAEQLNSIKAGGLPEGMGESSAFNIFDLFNTSAGRTEK